MSKKLLTLLFTSLSLLSCKADLAAQEPQVGRYQMTAAAGGNSVSYVRVYLLDTTTGQTWQADGLPLWGTCKWKPLVEALEDPNSLEY